MRELLQVDHNTLAINDAISGKKIVLDYRMPTSEERVAFNRACLTKVGNRVVFDANPARHEYGLKILVGFKAGAFSVDKKLIESNPSGANYYPGWKDLIAETASDLVAALAMVVFEGTRVVTAGDDIESADDEIQEAAEETGPLSKPSDD